MVTTTTSPRAASEAPWYHGVAPLAGHERAAVDPHQHRPARVVARRREHVEVMTLPPKPAGGCHRGAVPCHRAAAGTGRGTSSRRNRSPSRRDGDRQLESLGGGVGDALEDRDVDRCGTVIATVWAVPRTRPNGVVADGCVHRSHRSERSVRHAAGHGPQARPVASRPVLTRPVPPHTAWNRALGAAKRAAGELVHVAWETAGEWAAIGPATRRGRRFGAFGERQRDLLPARHDHERALHPHREAAR